MDILFLHVPKFSARYRPIDQYTFILFPPVGLLGLADHLRTHGFSSRLVHLGVEQHVEGTIDLERLLADHAPSMLGFDLHWHFQAFDVIETARQAKRLRPDLPIVLGGIMASLFAREILERYDWVDFVVRGDAEVPLLELLQQHRGARRHIGIPNLAFRHGRRIVINPERYAADGATLDSICFTDFTLMKDYAAFVRTFSRYKHMPDLSDHTQRLLFGSERTYQVCVGRGCRHACSCCGGGRQAQATISGRQDVAIRSVESIVSSLTDLHRFGFTSAGFAFDCLPTEQTDAFYEAIFSRIRRLRLPLAIDMERWRPPTPRFIEAFRLLPAGSSVTLTPHTPNEDLRRRNGIYRYSNAELEASLDALARAGIQTAVTFSTGLPFETREDLKALAGYQRTLRRRHPRLRFRAWVVEIEPGSRISEEPAAFGARVYRSRFVDYYRHHSPCANPPSFDMGYERQGLPSNREVADFFCRTFCDRFNAGPASPLLCRATAALASAGALRGYDACARALDSLRRPIRLGTMRHASASVR